MLRADNVSLSYGAEPVLEGASLNIETGQFVSLVGPSGSGKSSLLRAIMGLQATSAGRIDKQALEANDIGILDIKKRGTSVTPEELRRQLLPGGKTAGKAAGKKTATLVLTRIGEDRVAISVEPA